MLGWWHQCRRLEIDSCTLEAAHLQEFDADLAIPREDVPFRLAAVAHRVLPACLSLLFRVSLQDLIELGLQRLRYQFCAPSHSSSARGSIASGEAKSITASFATCGVPLAVSISSQTDFGNTRYTSQSCSGITSDHSSRIRNSHLITPWAVYFLRVVTRSGLAITDVALKLQS